MKKLTGAKWITILLSILVLFKIRGWVGKVCDWYDAYKYLNSFFDEDNE